MADIFTELNLEHDALVAVYPVSESNFNKIESPFLKCPQRRYSRMSQIQALIEKTAMHLKLPEVLYTRLRNG